MFSRDHDRQIIFRHHVGPKANRQDTLSFKRFNLGEQEWDKVKRHVAKILESQRSETTLAAATAKWLKSIPRKQYSYLSGRLLDTAPVAGGAPTLTLSEWVDEFEAARQAEDTLAETDAAVMRDVRKLELLGSDPTRIDDGRLADLQEELCSPKRFADNTLARMAKNWRLFFEFLKGQEVVTVNPCDSLNRSIGVRSKDTVQWEWLDQLVASCSTAEERYWLRLVQWTGCRLREGLTLRARDVDLARGRIHFVESKNKRIRVNPIYPAIAEFLPELVSDLDPDQRILSRITENNCYEWLYEMQDRVGVPRWNPPYNALRATRANQLASDPTITEQQAGMLLGHSPVVARKNYLKVEESLLERLAS